MNNSKTQVSKDLKKKSILVTREFNAPIELIWKAFTDNKVLDKWWGPSPWRAETKFQDFSVGGHWLYAMVGPKNQKQWGRMNYSSIKKHESFYFEDAFCDENGNVNPDLPVSKGSNVFSTIKNGTRVEFKINYSTEEQLETTIEMGFEEGITTCMEQLNQLVSDAEV